MKPIRICTIKALQIGLKKSIDFHLLILDYPLHLLFTSISRIVEL